MVVDLLVLRLLDDEQYLDEEGEAENDPALPPVAEEGDTEYCRAAFNLRIRSSCSKSCLIHAYGWT